ncbi:glycosyltransferase [Echinicola vietnamensis]|uniref:Glycosyltransferase n=1 Tax=Echinicola vietnamensis (strain DSM 17526 / LMG 23754 / KMM 6221) TaxID=926556 RepID=L0G426_ECHVK|nr:glycosyltransferase [Echinicola vietnamensis]AGA79766.1 glycosyltransferase [Echinicola vietnamensis DSM 17526]
MKKTKIVIASVLKPLTDSRAFYKLAISLRETNKYHINIIGFLEKNPPNSENIEFTSIYRKSRLHPARVLVPFNFFSKLLRIRPQLVIVTTYELLVPAILLKPFLRFKVIYDLQENYAKNIIHNQTMPSLFRKTAAAYVRFVENSCHPSIDHYFMAERSYPQEFPHITNYTILENKYSGEVHSTTPFSLSNDRLRLTMTGTLTEVYGIEDGIHWFKVIHKHFPSFRLHLIGHFPIADFRKRIEALGKDCPGIKLELHDRPVAQSTIYEALAATDILLLPYRQLPSIMHKFPTKIYEALAKGIPVITTENPQWKAMLASYPAGITLDFTQPENSLTTLRDFLTWGLFRNSVGPEIRWESEQPKLLNIVEKLMGT